MSVREVISIRSPNELLEECVKFTIDDVSKPFVLSGILEPNKEYTFSSWMMSEEGATIVVVDEEISVDTKWSRNKTTFIADTEDLKIYFQYPGIYYFFETQLEEGNIMTGWTPAPEDVDNEFKNYVTTTELNSAIEASANAINLSVSAVQEAVGEVESTLRNTDAKLELKVNKDELISEINASANVIRLKSNRLVVESDNLQILEDGTLKTQRGEIGGFALHDNTLSAEADRHAEINIKYHTYADAEPREGFIKIGNDAENEGGSGEGGVYVKDYDLDGYEIYTRIGNVLGGGILIETEEKNEGLRVGHDGIYRANPKPINIGGGEGYSVSIKGGSIYIDESIYLNNTKTLRAYTTDGESKLITGINTSDVLLFGTTDMNSQIRSNGLYITSVSAGLTNRQYGANKVLWTGQHWMNANHTATLSEAVSAQPNGIILVFSNYNDGADDSHFNCYFVPKQIVALKGGKGHGIFAPGNSALSTACYSKYLYIYNTKIVGNDSNDASSRTSASGITHQNNRGVMRYVIGV